MTFHIFDLVLLVLVAVSAFFAWRRGFIAETLSVIAWVLAFFASLYAGPWLAGHINVKPHWLDLGLGYVLVFVVVLLLISFMAHYIASAVKSSQLGRADRGLGLIYGAVRAMVVISVVYILCFSVLSLDKPHWLTGARSYPAVRETASVVMDLIPRRIDGFTIMPHQRSADAGSAAELASAEPHKNTARAEPSVEKALFLPNAKQKNEKDVAHVMPAKRLNSAKNTVKKSGSVKESQSGYSRSARKALDTLIEKNGEKEDR